MKIYVKVKTKWKPFLVENVRLEGSVIWLDGWASSQCFLNDTISTGKAFRLFPGEEFGYKSTAILADGYRIRVGKKKIRISNRNMVTVCSWLDSLLVEEKLNV